MNTARRLALAVAAMLLTSCEWTGLNSLPLPGIAGTGPGSFDVQAEMTDVVNIQPNSRVRVNDATVGSVTKVERRGWHALVTMRLDGTVDLPANATAKVGQTSLLGSLHIELAHPAGIPAEGRLQAGMLIPLRRDDAYPTTEETLAMVSMVLSGGGLGQVQDITETLTKAFGGREDTIRSLLRRIEEFARRTNAQIDTIIGTTESVNTLVAQFADRQSDLDAALRDIPQALAVLRDQRDLLGDAIERLGELSRIADTSISQTKTALVQELRDIGPVLESAANSGRSLTRSLSMLATYPWPKETLDKWVRGDYANMTVILDLTLSRNDAVFFTGTRWEGDLTELEMQWGRTLGQLPSPYSAGNPLIIPYHFDQGP